MITWLIGLLSIVTFVIVAYGAGRIFDRIVAGNWDVADNDHFICIPKGMLALAILSMIGLIPYMFGLIILK